MNEKIKSELFHNLLPNNSGAVVVESSRPIVGTIMSINVIPGTGSLDNGNITVFESGTKLLLATFTGVSGANSVAYPKVQNSLGNGSAIANEFTRFVTNNPIQLSGTSLGSANILKLVEIKYI